MSESVVDFVAIAALGLAAIGIGGPLTVGVFRFVDRAGDGGDTEVDSVEAAGQLLRGGAWIGCLERAAAFATVVAGWPEGLALIIAVKGLGRYSELRHVDTGAAERFIIGTLVSMLSACACAGLALTFVGGLS
ncbi:MAG: hypothetical protein M3423_00555 [Actinomycetota bacterium]|nr:hypothetical protein [Nocardioidaceae bacterium]MDQ3479823.1 hypothetical protein [Actinomycetota bacterium]